MPQANTKTNHHIVVEFGLQVRLIKYILTKISSKCSDTTGVATVKCQELYFEQLK